MPSAFNRRATQRGGMHRRPECHSYSLTGPMLNRLWQGTASANPEKAAGRFDTSNETALVFNPGKNGVPSLSISCSAVKELEYGQKAGRRVGAAITISPLALFSKKRKHYFTISYSEAAGKDQAVVFELGKDIVRTTIEILEVRIGREVILQDKEACRQFKTPKECEAK